MTKKTSGKSVIYLTSRLLVIIIITIKNEQSFDYPKAGATEEDLKVYSDALTTLKLRCLVATKREASLSLSVVATKREI